MIVIVVACWMMVSFAGYHFLFPLWSLLFPASFLRGGSIDIGMR